MLLTQPNKKPRPAEGRHHIPWCDPAYSTHLDRDTGAGAEGAFVDRHHGTLAVDDVEIRAAMLSALCWGCGLRG
ncbi:MAG TPA: hypothetical protein VN856_01730 [Mycobacterium sp.]|uniref:hypothetical protein n=1 Tax=Mycobacterium sp. TaxID=1785 RepID=UPI002BA876B2|nr:hypothetical protein [Mycobacterium sp.]HXO78587.1 hypothetical protein [Mycobacterium sp.]